MLSFALLRSTSKMLMTLLFGFGVLTGEVKAEILPTLDQNFAGGIAVNGQAHQQTAVLKLSDAVDVLGTITVDPADVGKTADIFVYAEATLPPSPETVYFMLGEGLTISLWDKNFDNLVAFIPNVTLGTTLSVPMYSGHFVYLGTLKVYFGYRLANGTLMANTQPIDITIYHQTDSVINSYPAEPINTPVTQTNYSCSGKVYCSEMTSCEEAMFYLRNCPGTKMDGNGDGTPCESQWCGHTEQ